MLYLMSTRPSIRSQTPVKMSIKCGITGSRKFCKSVSWPLTCWVTDSQKRWKMPVEHICFVNGLLNLCHVVCTNAALLPLGSQVWFLVSSWHVIRVCKVPWFEGFPPSAKPKNTLNSNSVCESGSCFRVRSVSYTRTPTLIRPEFAWGFDPVWVSYALT